MTVLIGALCTNGVVIGSDSSATFSTADPRIRTIEQPTDEKISIVSNSVILAGTGPIGLGQRFVAIVEEPTIIQDLTKKRPIVAVTRVCELAVKNFNATQVAPRQFGALLAFDSQADGYQLCEFSATDLQPELKTHSTWFAAMGVGQLIADPFMAFLRGLLWPAKPPSLDEGIFAILWGLLHTIEVNPGGIGGPPQVAVLTRESNRPHPRMLTQDELEEHKANVSGIQDHIKSYKEILGGRHPPRSAEPPPALNSQSGPAEPPSG